VSGVRTTLPVLRRILRHPDFAAGRIDTHFMERLPAGHVDDSRRSVAIIAAVLEAYERAGRSTEVPPVHGVSPWARAGRPGGGGSRWTSR
jgi:acetyl/propionyl-CoA carboxylase alpha subunit